MRFTRFCGQRAGRRRTQDGRHDGDAGVLGLLLRGVDAESLEGREADGLRAAFGDHCERMWREDSVRAIRGDVRGHESFGGGTLDVASRW